MTIYPGTSSVVASLSCFVELLLATFWTVFREFSRFLVGASERGFLRLSKNFVVHFKTEKNLWLTLKNAFVCFWLFKRWQWFLKHFKMTLQKTLLQFDDSCHVYVNARQYHFASFSTSNSTLSTSLRWPIRMRDFTQLYDSTIDTFLLFLRSQNKKLIFHWEARLISSLVLFQLQVEVHNFRPRCCKIQNSRVNTRPGGFSGSAFIMVFFGISCVGLYVHLTADSACGQDEANPEY